MREQMTQLLDEWGLKEDFDFGEFVSYYPVTVMCRVIASPDVVPSLPSSIALSGNWLRIGGQ